MDPYPYTVWIYVHIQLKIDKEKKRKHPSNNRYKNAKGWKKYKGQKNDLWSMGQHNRATSRRPVAFC